MRRALIALLLASAALFAGCGGADVAYTEVTTPPEGLPIPDGTDALVVGASDTPARGQGSDNPNVQTSDTDDTVTADPGTAAPVVTAAPETVPAEPVAPVVPEDTTDDDTGAAAPPATDDTVPEVPETDAGGGAAAPSGDQFCADNPGAC